MEDMERRVTESATFTTRDLDPRELRPIIERCDVAVTGRFHGMVSALDASTPPVVTGWSHKHDEVLDQFDVGEQGIAVADLSADRLVALVTDTLDNRVAMEQTIGDAHETINTSSRRNVDAIVGAAVDWELD